MNEDGPVIFVVGLLLGLALMAVALIGFGWPSAKLDELKTFQQKQVICPMCEGAGVVLLPEPKAKEPK